jgi:L-asparaginase
VEPFSELSENLTGEHLSWLVQAVSEKMNGGYDGVIVTHGTDTLQYSAAALGYALGNDTIPVCLVSSNFPIEDPRSNGLDHLHAAISLSRQGRERGVFVLYRNTGEERVECHRATRLSASVVHSDRVSSVGECPYGWISSDGSWEKNPRYEEEKDALSAPESLSLPAQSHGILRVFLYPGMVYPTLSDEIRAVLLDPYHSGTVDAKSEAAHAFFREAAERGIPVFVTDGAAYDSVSVFDTYGVIRLPLSPIAAYVKLWLYGEKEALALSRGGDCFSPFFC